MDCLLTTLKGTVSNSSLKKIGQFDVEITATASAGLLINCAASKSMTVACTNGYFTNSLLTSNLGTSITWDGSSPMYVLMQQGICTISFMDKYSITRFGGLGSAFDVAPTGTAPTFSISKFNFGELAWSQITTFTINYANLLSTDLNQLGAIATVSSLTLRGDSVITGIAANNTLSTGDLSETPGGSAYDNYTIAGFKSSTLADFSAFKTKAIGKLNFENDSISGGDLGDLNSATYNLALNGNSNTDAKLTFSEFDSSRVYMLNVQAQSIPFDSTIDAYLIANAALTLSPNATSAYQKTISLKGTRTSASDSAISILNSKGITVTITA